MNKDLIEEELVRINKIFKNQSKYKTLRGLNQKAKKMLDSNVFGDDIIQDKNQHYYVNKTRIKDFLNYRKQRESNPNVTPNKVIPINKRTP